MTKTTGFLAGVVAVLAFAPVVRADFDSGCIAIIVDDQGNGIVDTSGPVPVVSYAALMQQFYQRLGADESQDYDLASVFPIFTDTLGTQALIVQNDVQGLARVGEGDARFLPGYDNRSAFGAPNGTLQAIGHYQNVFNTNPAQGFVWPDDPNQRFAGRPDTPMSTIAMETSHRWVMNAQHAPGDFSMLRTDHFHFGFFTHTPSAGPGGGSSVQWGNQWQDNGDGTFTQIAGPIRGWTSAELYFMGLIPPEQVNPFFVITPDASEPNTVNTFPFNPDVGPLTVTGTRTNVTAADLVDTNGTRAPASGGAPKHFRQAFIMLAQAGTTPTDAQIAKVDRYRTDWQAYFNEQTNLIGSVDTCVTKRAVDFVFLLDLSGSFIDDLPVFRNNIGTLVDRLAAAAPGSRFALSSFKDFPFAPYGCNGFEEFMPMAPFGGCLLKPEADYAYRMHQALTASRDDFMASVMAIEEPRAFDGADGPQSQYEALYQVLTGLGRDLNGNDVFTDLGDIQPTDIGHDDDDVPLFIMIFTDAPFHDRDQDANYPFAGASAAGRADVVALLQNTPFIFGMAAPGGDTPELREVADLTGGDVFPLPADSFGFDVAARTALDVTPLPVFNRPELLTKLRIDEAKVDWARPDHGRRHHRDPDSRLRIEGTLTLPDGVTRDTIGKSVHLDVLLARHSLLRGDFQLHRERRGFGHRRFGHHLPRVETWIGHAMNDRNVKLEIQWRTHRQAGYELTGSFDAGTFDGDAEPFELTLLFGISEPKYSREAIVHFNQWKRRNRFLWLGPNGLAPAAPPPDEHHPAQTARAGLELGFEEEQVTETSDSEPGLACSTSARPSRDGALWFVAAAGLVVAARRRRRREA